jgi:hypothetical protein
MSEHTPTPWTVERNAPWSIKTNARAIIDKDRFAVAWAPAWDIADADSVAAPEEGAANAAFIVKAVNSHDALVKALEEIRYITGHPIGLTERKQIRGICDAILVVVGTPRKT